MGLLKYDHIKQLSLYAFHSTKKCDNASKCTLLFLYLILLHVKVGKDGR